MLTHLLNLLRAAWGDTLAIGGSSTVGIIVVGIIGSLAGSVIETFIEYRRSGWRRQVLKERLKTVPYVGAVSGPFLAWTALFAWSVVTTIYTDHLNAYAPRAKANDNLTEITQERDVRKKKFENKLISTISQKVNVSPIPDSSATTESAYKKVGEVITKLAAFRKKWQDEV